MLMPRKEHLDIGVRVVCQKNYCLKADVDARCVLWPLDFSIKEECLNVCGIKSQEGLDPIQNGQFDKCEELLPKCQLA